ncbi:cellulose synthase subunit BcsC-related outer membrane protein [Variovorax soli]|uniref:Tetratricopeptide (TPR) repeat protein n=1 Tax=Variovorax soli TaxID=376815 RepID=A0ABU1NEG8_9BURK|nr:cellulose synthase subunit BcsC-related outer membrane protein [Variovorax soli]MDR6536445.1 tetratricopeptide (TPR) repeat protein [Variovorax soli]
MPFDASRLSRLACLALGVLGTAGPAGAQGDARGVLVEQGIYWQSAGRIELAEASWRKLLSADPRSADAMYGMSQVELARGNTEAARDWIARLRAAHPGDPRVGLFESRLRQPGAQVTDLQAARSAARAGRTAEALQLYRAMIGSRPPPEPLAVEFYQLLGGSPEGWDEGRKGLELLVRDKPDNTAYRLALAQLLTYREPTRREGIRSLVDLAKQPATAAAARASWRQALLWLDARPADAPLYRDYLALQSDPLVAQRLGELGDLGEARRDAPAPRAADPTGPGFAALERGDLAGAERGFQEALRLRPGNTDALGGLGLVRLRQQRFAQAQDLLQRASKGSPRKWASALRSATYWDLLDQASAARSRNDPAMARSLLEQAVQLEPGEAAGRAALASLRQDRIDQARSQSRRQGEAGRQDDARRTLEAALAADPDSVWIRHDLALVYRRQGLDAQSRDVMESLPADQRGTPEALYARALLAADADDPAAGLESLERLPAAARTPDTNDLQRRLWVLDRVRRAREQARRGQADAARELLAETESTLGADMPREALGPLASAWSDAGDPAHASTLSRRLVADEGGTSTADQLLHASLLFKARHDGELAAVLERLQAADMTSAQRQDFDALRTGYEARQRQARSTFAGEAADRGPVLIAGTVYRHRSGEAGLGRLSDTQMPIEARLPLGEGRLVLSVTPTELKAGTLAADPATAGRFGGGPVAARLQSIGAVVPPGAQTARGVGFGVGYESDKLEAGIGTTPLGFAETNVIGNLTYKGQFGDEVSLKADLSRRPVTDSLLSFAGTRDPRTGVEWGGVVATGGRLDLARDFGSYGIYGYGSAHSVTGKNVTSNSRYEIGGGTYAPILRSAGASLTVGVNLDFLSYDKNLSQFTQGQGGYFSPQRYASLTFPLDWSGRDKRLSWRLNASVGVQSFREDPVGAIAADGTPLLVASGTRRTGVAYNIAAIVEYQLAPQLYLGGALGLGNARDYRQFTGNVYLRYAFGTSGPQGAAPGGTTLRPFSSPYTPLL